MNEFYIGFITFVASIIAFVSGFGLSTIMTSTLSFTQPFYSIIVLIATIHLVHSVWKLILYRNHINWHIGLLFGIPAVVGSSAGAWFLGFFDPTNLSRILGIFLIVYALIVLLKPTIHLNPSKMTLIVGGAISGFFAGLFGVRGAIRAVALSAYNLHKEMYIATTGFISIFVDVMRLIIYWSYGLVLIKELRLELILFILLSFIGALIGKRIVYYIPEDMFRSVVALFILLAGIQLVIWPF